jgi:hypothetical protein
MNDLDTIPTTDAAKTTAPGAMGCVVVDFDLYRKWILGEATARDVVEKVVGFE